MISNGKKKWVILSSQLLGDRIIIIRDLLKRTIMQINKIIVAEIDEKELISNEIGNLVRSGERFFEFNDIMKRLNLNIDENNAQKYLSLFHEKLKYFSRCAKLYPQVLLDDKNPYVTLVDSDLLLGYVYYLTFIKKKNNKLNMINRIYINDIPDLQWVLAPLPENATIEIKISKMMDAILREVIQRLPNTILATTREIIITEHRYSGGKPLPKKIVSRPQFEILFKGWNTRHDCVNEFKNIIPSRKTMDQISVAEQQVIKQKLCKFINTIIHRMLERIWKKAESHNGKKIIYLNNISPITLIISWFDFVPYTNTALLGQYNV